MGRSVKECTNSIRRVEAAVEGAKADLNAAVLAHRHGVVRRAARTQLAASDPLGPAYGRLRQHRLKCSVWRCTELPVHPCSQCAPCSHMMDACSALALPCKPLPVPCVQALTLSDRLERTVHVFDMLRATRFVQLQKQQQKRRRLVVASVQVRIFALLAAALAAPLQGPLFYATSTIQCSTSMRRCFSLCS